MNFVDSREVFQGTEQTFVYLFWVDIVFQGCTEQAQVRSSKGCSRWNKSWIDAWPTEQIRDRLIWGASYVGKVILCRFVKILVAKPPGAWAIKKPASIWKEASHDSELDGMISRHEIGGNRRECCIWTFSKNYYYEHYQPQHTVTC